MQFLLVIVGGLLSLSLSLDPSRRFAYYLNTTVLSSQSQMQLFSVQPCANNTMFVGYLYNASSGMNEIYLYNALGSLTPLRLVAANHYYPQVSADCQTIATVNSQAIVFRYDAGAGQYQPVLTSKGTFQNMLLRADGQSLLVMTYDQRLTTYNLLDGTSSSQFWNNSYSQWFNGFRSSFLHLRTTTTTDIIQYSLKKGVYHIDSIVATKGSVQYLMGNQNKSLLATFESINDTLMVVVYSRAANGTYLPLQNIVSPSGEYVNTVSFSYDG